MTNIGITSPRTAEYGNVRETKNGWNPVMLVMSLSPTPVSGLVHNELPIHSVMVSGILKGKDACPLELEYQGYKFYKYQYFTS